MPRIHQEVQGELHPRMILLPGGRYTMGSPVDEPGRSDDETQTSTVVSSFYIAQTEVTQAQWALVMESNPSYFQGERGGGPKHPVERVSVWDILVYLNRLSEKRGFSSCYDLNKCSGDMLKGCDDNEISCTGDYTCPISTLQRQSGCTGYRLPSEAEWEYATRAGTVTPLYSGDIVVRGGHNAPAVGRIGWYGGNSQVSLGGYDCSSWEEKEDADATRCGTQVVGAKPANPWGLHDVIGNVWEWTDSRGRRGLSSDRAVSRGCSWINIAQNCRAAFRGAFSPGVRSDVLGFRPARSVP